MKIGQLVIRECFQTYLFMRLTWGACLKVWKSLVSSQEMLILEVWDGAQECVLLKAPGSVLQSGKFWNCSVSQKEH